MPSKRLAFSDAGRTTLPVSTIPLTAEGLTSDAKFTQLIETVRGAIARATDGTPLAGAFPAGTPFTYWEQYIGLDAHLATNVGLALGIAAAVAVALLFGVGVGARARGSGAPLRAVAGAALWGGLLMALVVAMIVFEVYGFLGLLGIKLSAIPAISIVMAVGVGVEFTAHLVLAFVEQPRGAPRARRAARALDKMYAATWHGAVSTLLGVLMLAFSGIDFIFRYFFLASVPAGHFSVQSVSLLHLKISGFSLTFCVALRCALCKSLESRCTCSSWGSARSTACCCCRRCWRSPGRRGSAARDGPAAPARDGGRKAGAGTAPRRRASSR